MTPKMFSETLASVLAGEPDWALLPVGMPPGARHLHSTLPPQGPETAYPRHRRRVSGAGWRFSKWPVRKRWSPSPRLSLPCGGGHCHGSPALCSVAWSSASRSGALCGQRHSGPRPLNASWSLRRPRIPLFLRSSSGIWRSRQTERTSSTGPPQTAPLTSTSGPSINSKGTPCLALRPQCPLPPSRPTAPGSSLRPRVTARGKKVSILGGPPLTLFPAAGAPRGASWGLDNTIVVAHLGTGLFRGPAGGGEREVLTTPDAERGETGHYWPEVLPGGEGHPVHRAPWHRRREHGAGRARSRHDGTQGPTARRESCPVRGHGPSGLRGRGDTAGRAV